jgi:hypothetical protein
VVAERIRELWLAGDARGPEAHTLPRR